MGILEEIEPEIKELEKKKGAGIWNQVIKIRNEFENYYVKKYPLFVFAFQIILLIMLAFTVWELTKQDYKSRAICSFFYEVQPQVNECKQPAFICLDVDKQASYLFGNKTSAWSNWTRPAPGATPTP